MTAKKQACPASNEGNLVIVPTMRGMELPNMGCRAKNNPKSTENVLWDNEVKANRIMAWIMFFMFFAGIITTILTLTEVFDQPHFSYWPILMLLIEAMLLTGVILCRHFKGEAGWLKIVLFTIMIIAVSALYGMYAGSAALLMCIPVILSVQYFSKRFTLFVSLITLAAFSLSAAWGANAGLLNLNVIEYPLGTEIHLDQTTWLYLALEGIPYDRGLLVLDTLIYDFLPNMLIYLPLAAAAVFIAEHGRKLILKQQELTSKTARIETELKLAAQIQADALPCVFPAFPDRCEFELYASMDPAKEVGGDFYDYFLIDVDHLCLMIADVSGKGIPAALFMMASKAIIKSNAMTGESPAQILYNTNNALCSREQEDMFVTAWIGILEVSTGKLTAANGGHEYPALMKDGHFDLYNDEHGMVVGAIGGIIYQDYEIQMKPGDKLFVYTDGVPEANNSERKMFGTERMVEALNENRDVTPEKMLQNMREAVDTFVGNAEQFDDLTMLCLEYKG